MAERVRLSDEQRLDWLRLIRTEHVGPQTFRDLINHYGSARAALEAFPALARRGGASAPARIFSLEDAKAEMKAARAHGVEFLALGEPEYPPRLQMIDDAPPLLAVRGKIAALARPLVAIVGSRNASAAGVKFAQTLAHDLGQAGFGTVSGLTRGIDAAARRADGDRHCCRAGRRPRTHLPGRTCRIARIVTPRRRGRLGNAAGLGAARATFPAATG